MNRYTLGSCIGQGCYGSVHVATYKETNKPVAIKVLQNAKSSPIINNSLPAIAYRELKSLQRLQPHPHVLTLHEAFPHGSRLCLVTDLLHTDLHVVMKASPGRHPFPEATIKCIMQQLLHGVAHIHACGIMHRDIKPSNILFSDKGVLKIGDFGLARSYVKGSSINAEMTHEVGTKWYRSPELLLGSRSYTQGIDMWSVGCVLGEMVLGSPVFPGTTEIDQIVKIFRGLGSPTDDTWKERVSVPDWSKLQINHYPVVDFAVTMPSGSPACIALLATFLRYNHESRSSAADALQDPFFRVEPLPEDPSRIWLPRSRRTEEGKSAWDDVLLGATSPKLDTLVWQRGVPVMQAEAVSSCSDDVHSSISDSTSEGEAGGEDHVKAKGGDDTSEPVSHEAESRRSKRAPSVSPPAVVPRPPSVERLTPSYR